MSVKVKYKTQQRDILLRYLQSVPGIHFTASDVYSHFKKLVAPTGQSTIYRQLESLVDEGILNKYIIDGNSPACFEYVGPDVHVDMEICFHCKCEKCGKLIHLHCSELEEWFTRKCLTCCFRPRTISA